MRNPFKDLVFDLKKEYGDLCEITNNDNFCCFQLDKYYFGIKLGKFDEEQAISLMITNRNTDEIVANLLTSYNTIAFEFIKQLLK